MSPLFPPDATVSLPLQTCASKGCSDLRVVGLNTLHRPRQSVKAAVPYRLPFPLTVRKMHFGPVKNHI